MSDRELVIQVTSGEGEPPAMRATPGREVGPVSVGAAGAWRLLAPGVADKHAYLFYDGKRLYLQSCSSDLPALVDGVPVPLDWTPVDAPCEITMGTARLSFAEYEAVADYSESVSELGNSEVASYVSDDSYSSQSSYSNGSTHTARDEPPDIDDDSGVTRIEDISERSRNALAVQAAHAVMKPPAAPRPAAGAPADDGDHGMLADDGEAPTRIHGDLPSGPSMTVVGNQGMAIPASVRAAAASAAGGASSSYPASVVIQPAAMPPGNASGPPPSGAPLSGTGPIPPVSYPGWTGPQQVGGAMPSGPPPSPSAFPGAPHSSPGMSYPPGAPPPHQGMPHHGVAPSFGPPPGSVVGSAGAPPSFVPGTGPAPVGPPTASQGVAQARSFWREASTPKKITLLMMPFVVLSVGVIFSDNPRVMLGLAPGGGPAPPPTTASSSPADAPAAGESNDEVAEGEPSETDAAPAESSAPSGGEPVQGDPEKPAKSAEPVVSAPPPPPPAPKAEGSKKDPGEKSLERRATDAIARGQFKEAAALYEELAAKNPDRHVFKEAAEIMRLKAASQ